MLIHTTIGCDEIIPNYNWEDAETVIDYLARVGLETPISSKWFDPMDQPISYYGGLRETINYTRLPNEERVFTTVGMFNIVIFFEKPETEIFVERKNDHIMDDDDWTDTEAYTAETNPFKVGMKLDFKLSDIKRKDKAIDHLYGFAVRDIKPREIRWINLYAPTEWDSGILLYSKEVKKGIKTCELSPGAKLTHITTGGQWLVDECINPMTVKLVSIAGEKTMLVSSPGKLEQFELWVSPRIVRDRER